MKPSYASARRTGTFTVPPGNGLALSPDAYAMEITDNDLAPLLVDGDVIIVDPAKRPETGCHVVAWPLDAQEEPLVRNLVDRGKGADRPDPLPIIHAVVAVCRKL